MERDFRILTSQSELRVSQVVRRASAIFTGPPATGLVVGTFAAVPYIHLHLEARRRFYPDLPMLVHDDASPHRNELQQLCDQYGCEFESNDRRQPACIGDISCFLGGLLWGQRNELDLVVKISRRFIPKADWVADLQELALTSQYPTYSNTCKTYGFGFRTECLGMAVNEWIGNRGHEQLAMLAMSQEAPFVEGAVHNIARRLAVFRCEQAMRWDASVGSRPDDRDGYAPWDFIGTDRCEQCPRFLWHDWASPDVYHELARQWGLAYHHEDFADPNQGLGSVPALEA